MIDEKLEALRGIHDPLELYRAAAAARAEAEAHMHALAEIARHAAAAAYVVTPGATHRSLARLVGISQARFCAIANAVPADHVFVFSSWAVISAHLRRVTGAHSDSKAMLLVGSDRDESLPLRTLYQVYQETMHGVELSDDMKARIPDLASEALDCVCAWHVGEGPSHA